jgi:hypothetical protein
VRVQARKGSVSAAERVADVILALLRARAEGATICPSEVARALEPARWRPLMSRVREVAATMAAAGEVELRQRGQVVSPFGEIRGPLRIARGARAVRGAAPDEDVAAQEPIE